MLVVKDFWGAKVFSVGEVNGKVLQGHSNHSQLFITLKKNRTSFKSSTEVGLAFSKSVFLGCK